VEKPVPTKNAEVRGRKRKKNSERKGTVGQDADNPPVQSSLKPSNGERHNGKGLLNPPSDPHSQTRKKKKETPTEGNESKSTEIPNLEKASETVSTAAPVGGKKRRKRKSRTSKTTAEAAGPEGERKTKKQKTEDHEKFLKSLPSARVSDDRLRAYGLNPKKFRQKEKYVLLGKQKEKLTGKKVRENPPRSLINVLSPRCSKIS